MRPVPPPECVGHNGCPDHREQEDEKYLHGLTAGDLPTDQPCDPVHGLGSDQDADDDLHERSAQRRSFIHCCAPPAGWGSGAVPPGSLLILDALYGRMVTHAQFVHSLLVAVLRVRVHTSV